MSSGKEVNDRMSCPRCSGLMVPHKYTDLEGLTGAPYCEAWRCVNCGDLVDAVVLEHRVGAARPVVEETARRWPRKVAA